MLVTRVTVWNLLLVSAIWTMHLGGNSIAQESPGTTPTKDWKIIAQAEHRIYTGLNVNPEANGKTCRVYRSQEELHALVQPGQKGSEVEARICGLLKIDRIDWSQHMLLLLQPGFSSDYVTINIVSVTPDANCLTVAYQYFQRPRGEAGNAPQALVLVPKTSVDAKPAAKFVQLREGRKAVPDKANPEAVKPVAKAKTEKGQPAPGGNQIPDNVRAILEKADQIELFSIDPSVAGNKNKENLHGSHVLGKTVIKDAETRKKLMNALTKGVKDKQEDVITAAFYPRHAIRATHEKTTVDLLIGFDDSAIIVYNGDTFKGYVYTTASPRPVFDQVLRDAKVPLAKPNKN